MREDVELSERECEVLSLLMQGHETKSIAAMLGLSIHAVNERLRDARRKLGASSSREAARRYFGDEPAVSGGQISRDRKIGLGGDASAGLTGVRAASGIGANRNILLVLGVALMLSIAAIALALAAASQQPLPPDPSVVRTTPATGSTVAPGPFTLSVTFDRPMRPDNYSFVRVSSDSYPRCEGAPQVSPDRKTFSLHCTAEVGKSYEIWFNRAPYTAFQSETGATAKAYRLTFQARK